MSGWLIALLLYFVSWTAIPHLFAQRKRPAETLAWLWAILLFPIAGTLLYLLIGTDRFKRRRLQRRAQFRACRPELRAEEAAGDGFLTAENVAFARQIARINGTPITRAVAARLLPSADEFYDALERRIRQARHHVHIQFFIWRGDASGERLRRALIEAVRRGVVVRVLLDEMGSVTLPSGYFRELTDAGGEFSWFNTIAPRRRRFFFNLRNHRKLQLIDGRHAFVGGMNLGDEYRGLNPKVGPWRDLQIELEGSIACALQDSFADDWYFATEKRIDGREYFPPVEPEEGCPALVVTGGPDSANMPVQLSMIACMNEARKRLWIATGYFVPNDLVVSALKLSAARGIDVRVLISAKTDHPLALRIGRSYYDDLLRAGVRIFEYGRALHHMKAAVIDDDWATVGSANLDNRSLRLNFELNVLLWSRETNRELSRLIGGDLDVSHEVSPADRRSRKERTLEAICRPLAPIL